MREIPFSTILAALKNPDQAFPARYLERFSDLAPADVEAFMQVWPQVSLARKRTLMKQLVERYADDTLMSYDALAVKLLDDADAQVRIQALQLLDETGDTRIVPRLIEFVAHDPEPAARIAAAAMLGQFVRAGELEEIPAKNLKTITDTLLDACKSSDDHLARAALEAVGYSSRPEVDVLIASAFQRHDPHWQASALVAAGRSADARWQEQILIAFDSEDAFVRLAAVEAAGELEIKPARQLLINLLEDEDDDEVLQAAIWSLSQIGGEDVRTYLQTLLEDAEDDELIQFIEDALLNLSFTEDMEGFDMLAFDEDEPRVKKKTK